MITFNDHSIVDNADHYDVNKCALPHCRRRGGCVGGAALILKLKIPPPQLNSKHQTYWFLIVICAFDPNNDESVAALINVPFSYFWSIFLFH